MSYPARSGGEPEDQLLRAVARHWAEIRALASDEQWEQIRAVVAGTAFSPILWEARALLADLLLDVLPPDHEISVIMRTGVMSGTSAATADAQLLEELWRLSQQVNPGESTWPVVSRFKFSTSAQAVLSLTDSPSHAVPAPTDILLAAFAYGAVSGGVGRSMLKTLARRRGLQVDELIDRTQSELGGRMTPRLLGKPQRTAISPGRAIGSIAHHVVLPGS